MENEFMEMVEERSNPERSWREAELRNQFAALSSRDVQLWALTISTMIVCVVGFLSMALPSLSFTSVMSLQHTAAPFFFGLIGLVFLFNLYIISQRKTVAVTRWQLIQELMANEKLASVSLIDPLTQLFNRQSLDLILSREVSRCNRNGSSISFVLLSLRSPGKQQRQLSEEDDTRRIVEAGKIVRDTFRGLDAVLRYSAESFLAILPETNEQQAECALRRLQAKVDEWNLTTHSGIELTFVSGLATYVQGADVQEVIRRAQRKLANKESQLFPDVQFIAPYVASTKSQPRTSLNACAEHEVSASRAGWPGLDCGVQPEN